MNQQQQLIEQKAKELFPYPECNQWAGIPPEYIKDCEEIDKKRNLWIAGASWMGEGERLREAAESLLNALSKEHNDGKPIQRSIHVSLKIKALKEVLAPKPQTEHE